MHQIPTKSWTDMADLIVTSYAEDTLDEYGVARPFYKVNMKDTWKYLLGLGTGGYPIQGFNILCTVECRQSKKVPTIKSYKKQKSELKADS